MRLAWLSLVLLSATICGVTDVKGDRGNSRRRMRQPFTSRIRSIKDRLIKIAIKNQELFKVNEHIKQKNIILRRKDETLFRQNTELASVNAALMEKNADLWDMDDIMWRNLQKMKATLDSAREKDWEFWTLLNQLMQKDQDLRDKDMDLMDKDMDLMDAVGNLTDKFKKRLTFYAFASGQERNASENVQFDGPITDVTFCLETAECPCKTQKNGTYMIQVDIQVEGEEDGINATLTVGGDPVPGATILSSDSQGSCQVVLDIPDGECIALLNNEEDAEYDQVKLTVWLLSHNVTINLEH